MRTYLAIPALFLLIHGPALGAGNPKADDFRRAEGKYYPAAWTHGVSYCGEELQEGRGDEFMRTTKASGYQKLKLAFSGVIPSPPDKNFVCPVHDANQKIFAGLERLGRIREALYTVSASVGCENANEARESRLASARRGSALVLQAEPEVENALRELKRGASPVVGRLIGGSMPDDFETTSKLPECEKESWLDYMIAENLSCELYKSKLRFDYLARNAARGDELALLCFNDDAPAHESAMPATPRANQSDVTGLDGH